MQSPCNARTESSGDTRPGAPSATEAVGIVNPLNDPRWDEAIARHPDATVFQSRGWCSVLVETYGFQPRYLLLKAVLETPCPGLLPLMKTSAWGRKPRLISLPFTDTSPPLLPLQSLPSPDFRSPPENNLRWNGSLEEIAIANPILTAALRLAHSENCMFLELRDSAVWTRSLLPSVVFHGHTIPLESSETDQLSRCSPAMRRGLRKATQSPLHLKHGTEPADVRAYYDLHCQTRRRHGLPPQPFRFFESIQRNLLATGKGFVTLALADDTPVAGAVFLTFGRHALYKFGASLDSHLELRPNNLVLWAGIRRCAQLGFVSLDLGRTSLDNDGLRRFKLGLGGEERVIQYVRHNVRLGCTMMTPDRARGWHNRVFQILPTFASRIIGSLLYRHAA